jgi:hypothetical protein
MEPLVIEPIVNDSDFFARHTKEMDDVARGIFADRNDSSLAMRQPADQDATVEHTHPVIFFGDVKWREIMDSCDQVAWLPPQHATIAGDMQNIEALLPNQPRQFALVPKDVSNRLTETLRDGDDFHCSAEEIEQRQVIIEDEERE